MIFKTMKRYPKIKFKVSIGTDMKNAVDFIKYGRLPEQKIFATWFLPENLRYILNKEFLISEKNKISRDYTKKVYKERKREILTEVKRTEKEWLKINHKYFKLASRIFKNYPWPKGNYRGYASIFHMFPRCIGSKIFFFPYKHEIKNYANRVIAHEMLHFMFFDYIDKKYGLKEETKIAGKPKNFIWQVSEVFNNVMENWAPYRKIIPNILESKPYPSTEKMFAQMKKQWAKNRILIGY